MRVFVTGASGFVGSAIVDELIAARHSVLGLVRSDNAAARLTALGAEVCQGDVNDFGLISKAARECDAVIHTAFNHDFTQYKASCEADRAVIKALGDALVGTSTPLVITSGIGLMSFGRTATEDDTLPVGSDVVPRAASEEAAADVSAKGVKVYTVRLPPTVHGKGDHGFIPMIIDIAKEKEEAAYANDGKNRWPAVHRKDAAALYRLIIEQQPSLRIMHAVDEEGVAFKVIAEAIGEGLKVPVIQKSGDEIGMYFGWFSHFASLDCPASSAKTRAILGWKPSGPSVIKDMKDEGYFD